MDCAKIVSNQKEESISDKRLTVVLLNSDILLKKKSVSLRVSYIWVSLFIHSLKS